MAVARTDLPLSDHLEGLRAALVPFADAIDRVGKDVPVPTCPTWKTIDLVAHQGMVHRWATANIRGTTLDGAEVQRDGRRTKDPGEWLRDGAIEFVTALSAAPDDLRSTRFLRDAPPAKAFWARRQCHETTIHAVDAIAASLGRPVEAVDVPWVTPTLARDGIDELLTGFLPREPSDLHTDEPVRLLVAPTDTDAAWLVQIDGRAPVTTRLEGPVDADVVVLGPVVACYLTLWNRSSEVAPRDWSFWGRSAIDW